MICTDTSTAILRPRTILTVPSSQAGRTRLKPMGRCSISRRIPVPPSRRTNSPLHRHCARWSSYRCRRERVKRPGRAIKCCAARVGSWQQALPGIPDVGAQAGGRLQPIAAFWGVPLPSRGPRPNQNPFHDRKLQPIAAAPVLAAKVTSLTTTPGAASMAAEHAGPVLGTLLSRGLVPWCGSLKGRRMA